MPGNCKVHGLIPTISSTYSFSIDSNIFKWFQHLFRFYRLWRDSHRTNGSFTSPGHPTDYPHGANCTWYISVEPGNLVRLSFTTFNLEYHTPTAHTTMWMSMIMEQHWLALLWAGKPRHLTFRPQSSLNYRFVNEYVGKCWLFCVQVLWALRSSISNQHW